MNSMSFGFPIYLLREILQQRVKEREIFAAKTKRKNTAVQFTVRDLDAPQFAPLLKEGSVYLIRDFRVTKPKNTFNAVPVDLRICFTRGTKLQELEDNLDPYPTFHFNFATFNELKDRISHKKVLTDIIGILISFTPVIEVQLQNIDGLVPKRDIYIRDERQELLKVILYGNIASTWLSLRILIGRLMTFFMALFELPLLG
ncbi:hypothetical protein REPUB_Repub13aG0126700 [Reevesia pubescens]